MRTNTQRHQGGAFLISVDKRRCRAFNLDKPEPSCRGEDVQLANERNKSCQVLKKNIPFVVSRRRRRTAELAIGRARTTSSSVCRHLGNPARLPHTRITDRNAAEFAIMANAESNPPRPFVFSLQALHSVKLSLAKRCGPLRSSMGAPARLLRPISEADQAGSGDAIQGSHRPLLV